LRLVSYLRFFGIVITNDVGLGGWGVGHPEIGAQRIDAHLAAVGPVVRQAGHRMHPRQTPLGAIRAPLVRRRANPPPDPPRSLLALGAAVGAQLLSISRYRRSEPIPVPPSTTTAIVAPSPTSSVPSCPASGA